MKRRFLNLIDNKPWTQALLLSLTFMVSATLLSGQDDATRRENNQDEVRAIWNRVFADPSASGFSREANRFLVEIARDLSAGSALDIGMGEGRNSIFLAREGWKVTGIDISDEAVRQARATAKEEGLNLEATVVDVGEFDFGQERWDLVIAMYMHSIIVPHAEEIIRSLKPDGLLVIEGFHRDLNRQSVQGGYFGYLSNQLPLLFKPLRVLFYEDRVDVADWGGKQEHPIVRFVAKKSAIREP